jgi:FlaA1/EpsC-like NDP-sugar epimerase
MFNLNNKAVKLSIAIIGAGNAGIEMMQKMIEVDFADLVAVVDKNEEAPGIKLAQEKGIPTTNDFMSLFKDDNELDIIIDITDIKAVRDELRSFMQESKNETTTGSLKEAPTFCNNTNDNKLVIKYQ